MMPESNPGWSDHRMEEIVGRLLRAGVITAAAVVFLGGIVYLIRHGGEHPDYRAFRSEPNHLRSVPGILAEAASLSGRGIIQLGLLLLVATPVARVGFSVVGFARQHDRAYIAITLIVLVVLLYSLLGGHL